MGQKHGCALYMAKYGTFRKWAHGIKNIKQGKVLESHKGTGYVVRKGSSRR